jgi:hypothetical protein
VIDTLGPVMSMLIREILTVAFCSSVSTMFAVTDSRLPLFASVTGRGQAPSSGVLPMVQVKVTVTGASHQLLFDFGILLDSFAVM